MAHEDTGTEELTDLGKHLANLPVDARLGKLILLGSAFGPEVIFAYARAYSYQHSFTRLPVPFPPLLRLPIGAVPSVCLTTWHVLPSSALRIQCRPPSLASLLSSLPLIPLVYPLRARLNPQLPHRQQTCP